MKLSEWTISSWMLLLFLLSSGSSVTAQCVKIDSLEALLATAQSRQRIDVLNELSVQYRLANNPRVALDFANQAIGLANRLDYQAGLARAWVNEAIVVYAVNPQNKNFQEAIQSFNRALRIHKRQKDNKGIAETYTAYGQFYFDIAYANHTYYDSSVTYLEKAFQLLKQSGAEGTPTYSDLAEKLALVYYEKGDESKASFYAEKTVIKNDTKYSAANLIKKTANDQLNSQRFINWLFTGLFILVGIIVLILYQVNAQTRKANRLLETQKKELSDKNLEINQKNAEIEKRNAEIQEASRIVEMRSKEITRQNKEILLQQTEIELRNNELAEKNGELKQQQEEILAQRDNLSKQAQELAEKAEELKHSYDTITILSRVGQSITSTLDFKVIFDSFYASIVQMMPADGFRVSQYHPENGELVYKFNVENQTKKPLIKVSMREDYNPAVHCVKHARSIHINAKEDLKLYDLDEYSIKPIFNSMLYYPLLQDDKAIGAVGVYSKEENAYDQHDLDTLKTLASYVSIAFKNAETYEILNAAQNQLVESEKMAALGGLVAGVAHEINTPVGICVTAASRLQSKTQEFNKIFETGSMKRKDLSDFLEVANEGNKILLTNLTRAADLVQGFKRIAVEQSIENKRIFNLKTYLQETVMALQPELKGKPYTIALDFEEIEINSFAGAFSQIITNLVMNSLIHGFKGLSEGHIKIKTFTRYRNLIMTYSDDGNGMTPEVLNKIYEPFFTTNREGGGSGLGMNIVYNLAAQKLGGKLTAESTPGRGVIFTFEIPLNL